MRHIVISVGLAALLAGCATPPQNIKPVHYTGDTCTQEKMNRLQELSAMQSTTATNDAVGVFLIGMPLGSMGGGDRQHEIARLKGACQANAAPGPAGPINRGAVRSGSRTAPPPGPVRAGT